MGALKDLWQSERGLVAVLLIVACTVLAALGRLTVEVWTEYTRWIFVAYAAAKTVTGSVEIIKGPAAVVADGQAPPPIPGRIP